jgi:hypothetical protein
MVGRFLTARSSPGHLLVINKAHEGIFDLIGLTGDKKIKTVP